MLRRMTSSAAALTVVAMFAGGCATQPRPEPTAGFASEAEAFAAAEATYRAYVDTLNEYREDSSAPSPQSFLIGSALELDIATQDELDRSGVSVVGPTAVGAMEFESMRGSRLTVLACIDSSQTRLIDGSGNDITPPDRPQFQSVQVGLVRSAGSLLIESSSLTTESVC